MAQREKGNWTKKHRRAEPSEVLPPINSTSPRTNPLYCDNSIRIPRKAYDLAHELIRVSNQKAVDAVGSDVLCKVGMGRMILRALQEYAVAHSLLPADHPLLPRPLPVGGPR